ncbi:MAG: hypothetical protein ACREB1_05035 [Sphingomicrobium sp.]
MGPAPAVDVLGVEETKTIAMTVNCLEKVSDGTCNKKTCKKDAESDCKEFATGCINSDHKYEGTGDEGTCTRVKINI